VTHHLPSFSTDRPVDPLSLTDQVGSEVQRLIDWHESLGSSRVLCLTGAGLSTESGIPDYRGSNGSYHRGHQPVLHQDYMNSYKQRQRYWGRGLVGWKSFDERQPNVGHAALHELEMLDKIGVTFDDSADYYEDASDYWASSGQRKVTIITQNVDRLHYRAGSKRHVVELHGQSNTVNCMNCGYNKDRKEYHEELTRINSEWLIDVKQRLAAQPTDAQRPDGDTDLDHLGVDYTQFHVTTCPCCQTGIIKPNVVFFGDSIPKSRLQLCRAAVQAADGLLVVGSSLAVHSAMRHVREMAMVNKPIAIVNVGETRAEREGLPVTKIEAPAGPTLSGLVDYYKSKV
jgi:NAD+-dependent protein deacetylase sirtuin 4